MKQFEIGAYFCSIHGYDWMPDDPELYIVENPPEIKKEDLCSDCSMMMKQFHNDYSTHQGNKIRFNVMNDMTQKKLMLGRYRYLRYRMMAKGLEVKQELDEV